MPEPRRLPAATLGFACSCAQVEAAEARIAALAQGMESRCAALARAMESLPALASFDPFDLPPTAGDTTPASPAAASARGRKAGRATPTEHSAKLGQTAASRPAATPASAGKPAQSSPLAAAGAAVAKGLPQAAAQTTPTPPADIAGIPASVVSAGSLVASLVGELMARTAPAIAGEQIGRALAGRTAQAPARSAPARKRPAAPATRADAGLSGLSAAVAQGMRALSGATPAGPASRPSASAFGALAVAGGAASAGMLEAPRLIEYLLGGLTPAAPVERARGKAPSPAAPAPRAASRLLEAIAGQDDQTRTSPAAPAADPLPDDAAGEALARDINRLLLDQAWLRGVDLT
jgi:hypothetical protein